MNPKQINNIVLNGIMSKGILEYTSNLYHLWQQMTDVIMKRWLNFKLQMYFPIPNFATP